MANGLIIKAVAGVYTVCDSKDKTLYECKARGIFRKEEITPLVGDNVVYEPTEQSSGIINEILPRKNKLVRPAVANIDILFLVVAAADPKPNTFVMDKVIMNTENNNIEPIIVINKCDLSADVTELYETYVKAGFKTFCVSAKMSDNIDEIKSLISGNTCAFTGNTGVGKSSIINAINSNFMLDTGEISKKLGRGRHTTRHIELFSFEGGFIVDTPGFSSIDMDKCGFVRKENIQFCFREFKPYLNDCKFTDCSHTKEKGCAVIDAERRGEISKSRFESYCRFYEEAAKIPDWQLDKQ